MKTTPITPWSTMLFLIVFTVSTTVAQPGNKRVLGSFAYKSNTYSYEFAEEDIGVFSFHLSKPGDEDVDSLSQDMPDSVRVKYVFSEFSKDAFEGVFISQMTKRYAQTDVAAIRDKALEIFYAIKTRLDFLDDEPVTAYLILKKDYIKSILKVNASIYYKDSLNKLVYKHYVKRVSVETEDGAIKNIIAHLVDTLAVQSQSPREYLEFKNQYPISISGKFDPQKLSRVNLYCYECKGIEGLIRYIKLSDLISLDVVLENDKEDYSPANRTFTLSPASPIVEMKKEKRSRILEIAAFTDFVGMDREQPNGLVQIEARRKININTRFRSLRPTQTEDLANQVDFGEIDKNYWTEQKKRETVYHVKFSNASRVRTRGRAIADSVIKVRHRKSISGFSNVFGYIEPKLLFSKLEENNRFIDSLSVTGNKINPVSIFQYQVASFGANLQIWRLSFPQLKVTWNVLYTGAYWYRSKLGTEADSTVDNSVSLNSHYWLFGANLVFRPDSRWGALVGFEYIKQSLWNGEYKLANRHALLQPYFDAFIRTNEAAKLFFRFRWTFEDQNLKNNFVQIQLGYSMNLFSGPPGSATPK